MKEAKIRGKRGKLRVWTKTKRDAVKNNEGISNDRFSEHLENFAKRKRQVRIYLLTCAIRFSADPALNHSICEEL